MVDPDLMRGFPPPPDRRVRLDQVYAEPRLTRWYLQHVREISGTADVSARHAPVVELPEDLRELDALRVRRADGGDWALADMLEGTYVDGILVLRAGHIVYERYFNGLRPETPHLSMSVTKSLGSCVFANLAEEGLVSADDAITAYVPELAASAYGDATVRHLLDMTVGIRYTDDLEDPAFEGARLCRLEGVQPSLAGDEPGSAYDFARETEKQGEHGRVFHYVSLNTLVLGWVMERATGVPVPELIRSRVWGKVGAEHDAYIALDGAGIRPARGRLLLQPQRPRQVRADAVRERARRRAAGRPRRVARGRQAQRRQGGVRRGRGGLGRRPLRRRVLVPQLLLGDRDRRPRQLQRRRLAGAAGVRRPGGGGGRSRCSRRGPPRWTTSSAPTCPWPARTSPGSSPRARSARAARAEGRAT